MEWEEFVAINLSHFERTPIFLKIIHSVIYKHIHDQFLKKCFIRYPYSG